MFWPIHKTSPKSQKVSTSVANLLHPQGRRIFLYFCVLRLHIRFDNLEIRRTLLPAELPFIPILFIYFSNFSVTVGLLDLT